MTYCKKQLIMKQKSSIGLSNLEPILSQDLSLNSIAISLKVSFSMCNDNTKFQETCCNIESKPLKIYKNTSSMFVVKSMNTRRFDIGNSVKFAHLLQFH